MVTIDFEVHPAPVRICYRTGRISREGAVTDRRVVTAGYFWRDRPVFSVPPDRPPLTHGMSTAMRYAEPFVRRLRCRQEMIHRKTSVRIIASREAQQFQPAFGDSSVPPYHLTALLLAPARKFPFKHGIAAEVPAASGNQPAAPLPMVAPAAIRPGTSDLPVQFGTTCSERKGRSGKPHGQQHPRDLVASSLCSSGGCTARRTQ